MKAVSKFLAGSAAAVAVTLGAAAPAAAQYYPSYPRGGGLGDVIVGQVLNNILRGGNPYGYNGYYGTNTYDLERAAVDQCARATEQRLNGGYGGAYNNGGYGGGYNNGYGGYGNGYNNAGYRVLQIDRVERTRNGNMRVHGLAGNANYRGNYGYGYNNGYGYNQPTATPQYRFSCKFERSGRVTDLDINRNRYAYGY